MMNKFPDRKGKHVTVKDVFINAFRVYQFPIGKVNLFIFTTDNLQSARTYQFPIGKVNLL